MAKRDLCLGCENDEIGMTDLQFKTYLLEQLENWEDVYATAVRHGDEEIQKVTKKQIDKITCGDLIPRGAADLIVSLEPMEALRYVPYLAPTGWIITNTVPFVNIPDYPPMERVMEELGKLPHVIALDVDAIAKESGSARSANMVLLGATAAVLDILDPEKLREGIRRIFGRKGEAIVEANIKAFDAGLASAQK